MNTTGLLWYLLIYIFVIQLGVVGYLWSETAFYLLAGVNALALAVGAWTFASRKTAEKRQKADLIEEQPLIIEKPTPQAKFELDSEEKLPTKQEKLSERSAPTSASNIEQIKLKINRGKTRETTQEAGGLARFVLFLLSLLGFGGIVTMLWSSFDFIAVILAALGIIIFLMVAFKGANLWKKPIWQSLYVMIFGCLLIVGCWGAFTSDSNTQKNALQAQISKFIAGVEGEVVDDATLSSGYLYQSSGEVLDVEFSGDQNLTGVVDGLIVLDGNEAETASESLVTTGTANTTTTTTASSTANTGTISNATGASQTVTSTATTTTGEKSPAQSVTKTSTQAETQVSTQTTTGTESSSKSTNNQQLTILDAIKHLVTAYNIPLSTSKSAKFTHVATSSSAYPYMKTALEKRMIGTSTNPDTIVSCDVYMVMKGIAQGWAVEKTADVKAEYRNVAQAKNQLNGCEKGAKLTSATL